MCGARCLAWRGMTDRAKAQQEQRTSSCHTYSEFKVMSISLVLLLAFDFIVCCTKLYHTKRHTKTCIDFRMPILSSRQTKNIPRTPVCVLVYKQICRHNTWYFVRAFFAHTKTLYEPTQCNHHDQSRRN